MLRSPKLDPLFAPLDTLKGVGEQLSKVLVRLLNRGADMPLVRDLLFHLPVSVVDRRRMVRVAQAPIGEIATLTVQVEEHRPAPQGRARAPHRVVCSDETGDLVLVFFVKDASYLKRQLPIGAWRMISGRIESFDGIKQIVHPDYMLDPAASAQLPLIEPVYPMTEGLSPKLLNKTMHAALEKLPVLEEWIDPHLRAVRKWPTFGESLRLLHDPQNPQDVLPMSAASQRLAYDELFASQIAMGLLRQTQRSNKGRATLGNGQKIAALTAHLPFRLTHAQDKAIADILQDMASGERMLRLLQGDVGSGKTVVALMAMARAAEAGRQSALMAPTEILARQHLETLSALAPFAGLRIGVLTGRDKGRERKRILESLAQGEIDCLIGTHAIFEPDVMYHDLGLAIIDEQHRFGVGQRLALASKGTNSDLLVMTATPIPRTLVMACYGDMDVSKLDEKPAGRLPIDTRTLPSERICDVIDAVTRALAGSARVYWVCPLIEENEKSDLAAANARFADLQQHFGALVGLLHGRMKSAEKDAAIAAFAQGETRILVATTVIEVGVNVPEATIMVIEGAERFGLSQLHQLRGRVGRASQQSVCLLLYGTLTQTAKDRLQVMRDSNDGFVIAEADLKLRGPGEVLGTRQSGLPDLRLVRWEHHTDLIPLARDDARALLAQDPALTSARGAQVQNLLQLFDKSDSLRLISAG